MTREIHLSEGRHLDASPAEVWAVLGDFGNEHRWAPTLAHCTRDTETIRVGTVRSCTLAKPLLGRTSVEEELTEYEPGRALAYQLRGGAGPFRTAGGRWEIYADEDGTFVSVTGRFVPRNAVVGFLFGGLARLTARRAARRSLSDLATYLTAPSV
jgi:uncharacterized protein YndB with AHSA1/START domain